jgi:hypothetical protein
LQEGWAPHRVAKGKKEGVREMKTKSIARYGLVVLGLLLAGVMFLPGRAMAPPLPYQHKEPVKIDLHHVVIGGHVQLPGGRGLRDVKIHLYEIRDGGQRFVTETITNNEGFYSMSIGGGEKSLWLVPNYATFGFGEHLDPREYRFSITSVTTSTERNFHYTGPLPDLVVSWGEVGIWLVNGKCRFGFPIHNGGGLASRYAFKVKVRYWDRSAGSGPRAILKEKIVNYPYSICPGCTGFGADDGGQPGVVLGPGTAGDESSPGQPLKSASGRYEVTSVELDCADAVVESNEGNNRFP